jgi:hypothetical protein
LRELEAISLPTNYRVIFFRSVENVSLSTEPQVKVEETTGLNEGNSTEDKDGDTGVNWDKEETMTGSASEGDCE